MNIEEAMEIVKQRYGLLTSYVDARTGKMMAVVKAEPELRAIPEVPSPEGGIALFYCDVIELAKGRVTIKDLVRRKNPEIFTAAELGRKGGRAIARRGPDYFRELQAKRKERKGGRPPSKSNKL
jgi:hypothetical protein